MLKNILYRGHIPTGVAQKLFAATGSAVTALLKPQRGDMVGTLGEVTGRVALERLRRRMLESEGGRKILASRPMITDDTVPECGEGSFGHAYMKFMVRHGFNADDRSPVALVDDEELAYVMLRYRQVHDFWHVLCGLPPTLLGEIALKWFELVHTDLPIAAFSAVVGPLRLKNTDRTILRTTYLPWALTQGKAAHFLLAVPYEDHFHTSLSDLRHQLNLLPAPRLRR